MKQLKAKREKICAKLLRESGMVNDMLYSFTNASAVAEEMEQLNDMLKLLKAVNDEYQHLLTEDKLLADNQWFEEQDERVFSFKYKIIKCLRKKIGNPRGRLTRFIKYTTSEAKDLIKRCIQES